jgi:DNA replication protein
LAARQPGTAVRFTDLLNPGILRSAVGLDSPLPAEERLRRALERAVANGFLLRVSAGNEQWFLPASVEGRDALDQVRAGLPRAREALGLPPDVEISLYRPNVFALYEQHIGPLTPLVAERLRDAERAYPRAWIERAVLSAVHYNRRSWSYIEAILARWERAGGPHEANG